MNEMGASRRAGRRSGNSVTIVVIICATLVCLASVGAGTWILLELIKEAPW